MENKARAHRYRKTKRKSTQQQADSNYFDALPWSRSLPDKDPLSLLVGVNEGGFLSLEEIEESEYDFNHELPEKEEPILSSNSKKRKRTCTVAEHNADNKAISEEMEKDKNKKKKLKKKKKKQKKQKSVEENAAVDQTDPLPALTSDGRDSNVVTDIGDHLSPCEDEFSAWEELRLHPLLVKSIHRLGFKEPTPIQKACIPAAAHQGKDVIGAAETGSGKTLAFGLPILQRLLEEHEKAAGVAGKEGNMTGKEIRGTFLRALVVTPTRELALQVSDHLKEVAKLTNIWVVAIVGGMSMEKQERLLRGRPEIIVGTPGRLWELMSGGAKHLLELHSLSFFVLDEADRMIENGHFQELQSIIDMLPMTSGRSSKQGTEPAKGSGPLSDKENTQNTQDCETVANLQRKKRQTFVFSATIALSADFRKKLKRGSFGSKGAANNEISSIETLSERAGMRADAAIVDLTNASIVAHKLEESFIECKEEDKEAYLYYLLGVHGRGQTIVFCTSIAALRRIASILRILRITVWTLHAQMQQRARLKAIDHFRESEHGVLVATDVAARGLDVPGVRTVIHFQLPHSAEVYVHRSGRTARASADGCSIALISPNDRYKFASLCKSFSKECLCRFPLNSMYMPEVLKRLSLARQIDKITRKNTQVKAQKSWFERNAESVELDVKDSDSEEERTNSHRQKKISNFHLKQLQQELNTQLARPLQPMAFSRRYLAGAGMSPLLQQQLKEMASDKQSDKKNAKGCKKSKLVVIGQDWIEPLEALRSSRA